MSQEKEPTSAPEADAKESKKEYRGLLPRYTHYHKKGAKDIAWGKEEDLGFHVQLQRATSVTNEQFAIQIPIYKTDTREEMRDRLQLAYSIVQERLEDENDSMIELHNRQQEQQRAAMEEQLKKKITDRDSQLEHNRKKEVHKFARMLERGKIKIEGVPEHIREEVRALKK